MNWQEGQAPSTVNDSARAMMAATAKYRDDIAGAIVTSGSSTAYTVSSYEVFDTLAHLGGQMIAFTPHTTNGATVTLNVDSLGAKPLRSAPFDRIASRDDHSRHALRRGLQ
jgi:fatty acid/phospholipid biosynthesis enzyme